MRFLLIGITVITIQLGWCIPDAYGLQAGVAKAELPPPAGAPLAGYRYRQGHSSVSQHAPLWSRALYLEQDGTAIAWVSLDLHSISPDLLERVRELSPAGLSPDHIILTATHTHNSPGGYDTSWLFRQFSGRYNSEWVEVIAQTVTQIIEAAMADQKRATIGFAESTTNPLILPQYDPEQIVDPSIGVIRVDDSDGTPMALITSMGARPALLGKESALALSPDYPGYYATALEALTPEGCVAFFVNGASGDQVCANSDNLTGKAWAENMGQQLAERTKSLSNTITGKEVSLSFFTRSLPAPPSIASPFLPDEFILQAIAIDKTLISFWPGTLFSGFSKALKNDARSWGFTRHIPVGVSNGNFMSLVPPEQYEQSLDPDLNLFGPDMLAWCTNQLDGLVNEKDDPAPATVISKPPAIQAFNGGIHITLSGSPEEMGYQLGLAQRDNLIRVLDEKIYSAVPQNNVPGFWKEMPHIQSYPLMLPFYLNEKRTLLSGWYQEDQSWLQGLSNALQLPFDYAALLESYELISPEESPVSTLQGVLFGVTDNKAGENGLLVGRTLEYPDPLSLQIVEVHPEKGRSFVYVGASWQSGAFTGMNDAGVVVCAEWLDPLTPPPHRIAAGYILKNLLNSQNSFEKALPFLNSFDIWQGFRILIADRPKTDAVLLEFGAEPTQAKSIEGILIPNQKNEALHTYIRLLNDTGSSKLGFSEVKEILIHRPPWSNEEDQVFNSHTAAAVIFEPTTTSIHVSTPGPDGSPSEFYTVRLSRTEP